MGAMLALPVLDAMIPAGAGRLARIAAAKADPTRLIAIEMVHGAAGCNAFGATQPCRWVRAERGRFGSGCLAV